MGTIQKPQFHWLYALSIVYVAAVYAFPFLWFALNRDTEPDGELSASQVVPLLLPAMLGVVNLAVCAVCWDRISLDILRNCAVIIKYSLIPFFIAGGLLIALTWLLTFSPVVIMIFIGPVFVAVFSVLGYLSMLGSAPFSIGYLIRSARHGLHPKWLCVIGGVLQFFFVADTISIMVLVLKERKCIKATIVLGCLLLAAFLALVGYIAFQIVKIAVAAIV